MAELQEFLPIPGVVEVHVCVNADSQSQSQKKNRSLHFLRRNPLDQCNVPQENSYRNVTREARRSYL